MEVKDLKTTLQFARAELDNRRESNDDSSLARAEKAINAVETWLRSIGALPPR